LEHFCSLLRWQLKLTREDLAEVAVEVAAAAVLVVVACLAAAEDSAVALAGSEAAAVDLIEGAADLVALVVSAEPAGSAARVDSTAVASAAPVDLIAATSVEVPAGSIEITLAEADSIVAISAALV
jgi:hypothetical protein